MELKMMGGCKALLYLSLIVLIPDACTAFNAYCGDSFQVYGQNYCYMISNVKLTWSKAYRECQKYNAGLVRIFDNQTLSEVLGALNGTTGTRWWTALNNKRSVGQWVWGVKTQATEVDLSIIRWIKEPDEANHRQNCAALNYQGSMSDERCWDRHRYVCEYANTPGTPCAESWSNYSTGCYLFPANLRDPFSMLSWNNARQKCINTSQDMTRQSNVKPHLLQLDTQDELDYIRQMLPRISVTSDIWWIGLNDSSRDGQWRWLDGSPLKNPIWAQEPNNLGGQEKCGYMNAGGQFGDLPCGQAERYICYKENDANSQPDIGNLGCPAGWTRAGHYCYLIGRSKQSWTNASLACQSYGSNLIKVDDPDKKVWLENQNKLFNRGRWYWTGLNRLQGTTWSWADNSAANMSLVKWNTEPNNYVGLENCAVILRAGTFNDVGCLQRYGFICEQNLEDGPCSPGWLTINLPDHSNCYYISTNMTANYDEANSQCNQLSFPASSYLVAFNTKQEITTITQKIQAQASNISGWYTGLIDTGHEGLWTYDTSFNQAPASGLIPWSKMPEFVDGDENCAAVIWGGNYLNTKCNIDRKFICERPAAGFSVNAGTRIFSRTFSPSSVFIVMMYGLSFNYILHSNQGRT